MHQALVDQAKRGDREAFDALARMVGDRCMAIAFRILRDADPAQDAVQAALVVAWRELRTLRDSARFEPWLHRILTNECYAEARRRSRWSTAQVRLLPMSGYSDSAEISAVNDRDQLDRAFRRLTLEQRSVLVFHHYVGLPLTEVADLLGIPLGTAKSRLHRATSALRASLEADARSQSDFAGATRMTAQRDPDQFIRSYLEDGLTELPDSVYDAVRSQIDQTRQRVVIGPWRLPSMNNFARFAIAGAAVLVVALAGVYFLPRLGGIGGPGQRQRHRQSPDA